MGRRGKVILQRIEDDIKRRASLKKRKAGLLKKANELSILCDVEVAAIIYSPEEAEPTIWPFTDEVNDIIAKFFQNLKDEGSAKEVTQRSYLCEMVNKAKEKLKLLKKKNEEKHAGFLLSLLYDQKIQSRDFTFDQFKMVNNFAERRINMVKEHIQYLRGLSQPLAPPTHLPSPPCGALPFMSVRGSSVDTNSNCTSGLGAYCGHMNGTSDASGMRYDI